MNKDNLSNPRVGIKQRKSLSTRISFAAFLLSVPACIIYFLKYASERYFAFGERLNTEPEHYKIFSDLFHEYGCNTYAEFRQFLAENSYSTQGWELVDGVFRPTMVNRYNEVASVANERYQTYMDRIVDYLISDPQEYLELDPLIVGIIIAIPIILFAIWLILRYRDKKDSFRN